MDNWEFNPVPDIDKKLKDRLEGFPREPDIFIYMFRSLVMLFFRFYLFIYHRIKIKGKENIPKNSSCVIVANHSSHLDTISLSNSFPLKMMHHIFPLAAKDYFFGSLPKDLFSAVIINAIPFDRKGAGVNGIAVCREILNKPGNVLIVFPEGTRTKTGVINDFKPGIGLLTAGLDIPVVPCHINGTYKSWSKGSMIPKPFKISLNIGKALSFCDLTQNKENAKKIAIKLFDKVKELEKTNK